jgi:hypothetical protein
MFKLQNYVNDIMKYGTEDQHNKLSHTFSTHKKGKLVPLHAMDALGGRGDIAPTRSRPRH